MGCNKVPQADAGLEGDLRVAAGCGRARAGVFTPSASHRWS